MATVGRVLRRASVAPRCICSASFLEVLGSEKVNARRCYSSAPSLPSSPTSPPQCTTMEALWLKDYFDYRKSVYGEVTHRALLVDVVGTLIVPAQPTAQVSYFVVLFCHLCCCLVGDPISCNRNWVSSFHPFFWYVLRISCFFPRWM